MAKYRTRPQEPVEVEAFQVHFEGSLLKREGVPGDDFGPGDWVVNYPDGEEKVFQDADFKAEFIAKRGRPKRASLPGRDAKKEKTDG